MLKKVLYSFIILLIVGFIVYESHLIASEPENLWGNSTSSADCGVVLTGASGRVREGFEFLAQKRINKLIVSGVYKEAKLNEIFPYSIYYPEVNLNDIYLEKRSETTFGNARHSLSLAEALKCRDVLLITSQVHMHRAYDTFKIIFPEQIILKKLSLPNAKSEEGWTGVLSELIKNIFYYLLIIAEKLNIFS